MSRRRGASGGLMNVILGMGRIEFYTTESGLVGFLDKEGRKLDFSLLKQCTFGTNSCLLSIAHPRAPDAPLEQHVRQHQIRPREQTQRRQIAHHRLARIPKTKELEHLLPRHLDAHPPLALTARVVKLGREVERPGVQKLVDQQRLVRVVDEG